MDNGVKKPWLSKTLWTNLILAVAAMFWPAAGDAIANHPEVAAIVWSGINMLLRFISKDQLQIGA